MNIIFTQGKRYSADITLTVGQALFGTNAIVAEKLVEAGFKEVTVIGSGTKRKATGAWVNASEELTEENLSARVKPAIISNITEV